MKSHDYKSFASKKSRLIPLAISLAGLSAMPAMAQVNSVIFGTGPAGIITPLLGPNGESVTLTTQISAGNFFGFGNEFLYQYNVLVNAGSARVDGLNLWTPSAAVFNGGGNIAQTAINMATTGAAANGGAVLAGNAKVASQIDPGGNGPAGSVIPPTPGGAAIPNGIGAFIPTFSTTGNAIFYVFPGLAGNLSASFNFDTTVNGTAGQNVGGLNWGFTDWSNGDGNNLIRWFAVNPGADGLLPGQSMTFDAFSPFPPVAGGAFPDPPSASPVYFDFDDSAGGVSDLTTNPDVATPEPSTASLLITSALSLGWWVRRKSLTLRA